ncbi:MAG TPA: hypothetical protein VJ978_13655, partial [Nitriliruptoraceae bacterium]|nr:hypothetical protein [Nitriliruptoraceae bacterium]
MDALLHDLRPITATSRRLSLGGAAWVASAVVHVGMLASTGFVWQGAVSWRKPIVFGFSIGLLLATIGWVLDRLDPDDGRLARGLGWTLLVSSSIEVGLITLQAWRGEASHFNVAEPTDAAIFAGMGAAIAVMSVCLVTVFAWVLRRRPTDPVLALALTAGMGLVMAGLGVGQWAIELG